MAFTFSEDTVKVEQAKADAEVAKARIAEAHRREAEAKLRLAEFKAGVEKLQPWSVAFCGGIVGGFIAALVVGGASAAYYFNR